MGDKCSGDEAVCQVPRWYFVPLLSQLPRCGWGSASLHDSPFKVRSRLEEAWKDGKASLAGIDLNALPTQLEEMNQVEPITVAERVPTCVNCWRRKCTSLESSKSTCVQVNLTWTTTKRRASGNHRHFPLWVGWLGWLLSVVPPVVLKSKLARRHAFPLLFQLQNHFTSHPFQPPSTNNQHLQIHLSDLHHLNTHLPLSILPATIITMKSTSFITLGAFAAVVVAQANLPSCGVS